MVSVKYTYSISQDFLNAKVNTIDLTSEIRTSSITIALDYINTLNDNCDIWFKNELSEENHKSKSFFCGFSLKIV